MTCANCEREFLSDNTPMARGGYCMFCRSNVVVECARCGEDCLGAPDGQERCKVCRATPQGRQQNEDRQLAVYRRFVETLPPSVTEYDQLRAIGRSA